MMVRKYEDKDIPAMIAIWNEVVEDGIAFPQEELLDEVTGKEFFESQTYSAVAEENGKIYVPIIMNCNIILFIAGHRFFTSYFFSLTVGCDIISYIVKNYMLFVYFSEKRE